jgi:hypothetical protein
MTFAKNKKPFFLLFKVCTLKTVWKKCGKPRQTCTKLTFLKDNYVGISVNFECCLFCMFSRLYIDVATLDSWNLLILSAIQSERSSQSFMELSDF